MQLNQDILFKINSFLEPDIALYTRLAAVNKVFYSVFTSDTIWRDLNPYGVKSGIFASLNPSQLDCTLLRYYLVNGDRSNQVLSQHQLKTLTTNQFVWLAFLLSQFDNCECFQEYESLIECLIHLKIKTMRWPPEFTKQSLDWALKLLPQRPEFFDQFDRKVRKDPRVFAIAASLPPPNFDRKPILKVAEYDIPPDFGPEVDLAVLNDPRNLEYAPKTVKEKFIGDYGWASHAVQEFPSLLEVFDCYKDNEGFVLQAFSKPLKNVVKDGIRDNLEYVSERLRRNPAVCRQAVAQCPANIKSSLVDDIDLLKSAYKRSLACPRWESYRFNDTCDDVDEIYSEFNSDPEAQALHAAHHREYIARSAPLMSFDRPELMTALASHLPHDTYFMAKHNYRDDPSFYVQLLQERGTANIWKFIPDEIKQHEDVVLKALEVGLRLEVIDETTGHNFSNDRKFLLVAAKHLPEGRLLKIPEKFSNDREIIELAVTKCGCALQYASPQLQADKEFILQTLDTRARASAGQISPCMPFKYISPVLLKEQDNIKQFVEMAQDCPTAFLGNQDIALIALKYSPFSYSRLPNELKASRDFNQKAASVNGSTLRYMSPELWRDKDVFEAANLQHTWSIRARCPRCFE